MDDYEKRRLALLELIDEVHERQELFYTRLVQPACDLALSRVAEEIDRRHDEEIAKLKAEIEKLNRNSANGSFLVDLVFAIVVGPLFGHVVELGLKSVARAIVNHREQVYQLAVELEQLAVKAGGKLRSVTAESFTPEVMKRVRAVMLGDIPKYPTSLPKFFDLFTPFANDALQVFGPKAAEALAAPTSARGNVANDYRRIAEINRLPRSDLLDSVQDYVTHQLSTNLFNKYVVRWLALVMPATSFIDELAEKYQARYAELTAFDDPTMKQDLTRLFEAMIWVYYLGKPEKWATEKSADGGYFHGYQLNPLTQVFELRIAIAKSLFAYLVGRFVVPNTTESFLNHYRAKKMMRKGPWGYGVDTKDPAAGWRWQNYTPFPYIQTTPDKPIDDPTSGDYSAYEMAGYEMVRWFKILAKNMHEQEGHLAAFLARKGVKEVPQRPY